MKEKKSTRLRAPDYWEDVPLDEMMQLGETLDARDDFDMRGLLPVKLLRVRDRSGNLVPLAANRVQLEYEKNRGDRNIVLKARQLGISTWIAARFFLRTVTRPGTLSVQVAHTRSAAEEIFRIVHRFHENLPPGLRTGVWRTTKSNVHQLVFPELDSEYRVESAGDVNAGRGLTIQNLHCSEVARWPGDAAETLASLRAALAPKGELVLESTPRGAHGCFYEEWQGAEHAGTVRHFFPWWWEREYKGNAVSDEDLTEDERALMLGEGLTHE